MQAGIVFGGRAPEKTLQGSAKKRASCDTRFLPGAYHDSPAPVVALSAAQTGANGSINASRNQDSSPGSKWKVCDAAFPAGVVAIGQVEELRNRTPQKRTEIFSGQEQLRRLDITKDRRGKITAVHAGILGDVATNIGELHGNAEVHGMGIGERVVNIQHTAHHDAHGAGHPIGVAQKSGFVRGANKIKIRKESLDKFENDFRGNSTFVHEVDSVAESGIRGDTCSDGIAR